MTSYAEAARRAEAAAPKPRQRSRARTRRPVTGGIVWIAVLAVLLGGVVAVNVAVLQLNVRLDQLGRDRLQLQADNARLRSQLSSAAANARIEDLARTRLGEVEADQSMTTYVDIAPRRR